jgi:hypothetical protein
LSDQDNPDHTESVQTPVKQYSHEEQSYAEDHKSCTPEACGDDNDKTYVVQSKSKDEVQEEHSILFAVSKIISRFIEKMHQNIGQRK